MRILHKHPCISYGDFPTLHHCEALDMLSAHAILPAAHRGPLHRAPATLVRDLQACIPLTRILGEGDVVVLLTPVIKPLEPNGDSDPFEPLGRALAARHPWIRHVPYSARNGITSTHVGFIKRAKSVLFVITGPPTAGQAPQADVAQVVRMVGHQRPLVILACRDIHDLGLVEADFPTLVQLSSYAPADLQASATLLLGSNGPEPAHRVSVQELIGAPKFWPPESWDGLDVRPVQALWNQSLPKQFHLDEFPLRSLLQRDGYAMHFVVRLPDTREIIGLCATYTTFADNSGERLIGSLALIIVKSTYRRRGIGRSLYDHALKQLRKVRGVDRIQLGSTFPRLLRGIPAGFAAEKWFQSRGWGTGQQISQHRQDVYDWLLRIEDWPEAGISAGLTFRQGTFDDFDSISRFIEKESVHDDHSGWYDQYMNLAHDGRLNDIILGIERSEIIAAALVYTTRDGSPLTLDIPWTQAIGSDVGGVTCICITDSPAMTSSRDTVMIRLLDACITVLKNQGMERVFLDAVKGGREGFQSMGFQKWATYKDLWQPA
ncbi:hypothetical protein GGR56DRAFT_105876 [Xylariaceae sp. FL0804]|nr:hypothetical protein GGR56DRAFT_105876 [Xylariaceae sp. FL0804]